MTANVTQHQSAYGRALVSEGEKDQGYAMASVSESRILRLASNRLVRAASAGALVWFADQPTVDGYHPLFEMFWSPGFCRIPSWDRGVLLLSWLATTLFCHFILFALQKIQVRK